MTTLTTRASIAALLLLVAVATAARPMAMAQPKEPSAVEAWVAAPAAGATSAAAYVEVNNPTMYDIFIVKATADGAPGKWSCAGRPAAAPNRRGHRVPGAGLRVDQRRRRPAAPAADGTDQAAEGRATR